MDSDWPMYTLKYKEGSRERSMELPMTFADFAVTEARFRKHFRKAPPDTWNENMIPIAEFLDLPADEREGKFPYVWSVDRKGHLSRLVASLIMVESCEERRDFWVMLRAIAGGVQKAPPSEDIESKVRQEVIGRIASGLMKLADGSDSATDVVAGLAAEAPLVTLPTNGPQRGRGFRWRWLHGAVDRYRRVHVVRRVRQHQPKHLQVQRRRRRPLSRMRWRRPYKDLVKAAEKCTAQVIHPGLPKDMSEKDVDKWIERAKKYN